MPLPELSHTYHRKNGIPKSVKQYEFFQMTKRALVVLWRVNFAGHERGKHLEDPHATWIIRRRGREGVKVLDHRTGRDCHADRILWVSRDRSNALFYLPAIQDPENLPVYTAVYWKCSNNMLKYSRTKTSTDVCKHINAFKMIAGHGPTERSVQAAKSLRGNQDLNFKSFLISELKKLVLGATSVSHLQNLFLYLPHLHQLIHEC